MNRKEKVAFAKRQLSEIWKCDPSAFDAEENIFLKTEDTFFEIITFGKNAVMRGEREILNWCSEKFSSVPAREIMDGDNLYVLETKLRSYGRKLGGEHVRYLHLYPEKSAIRPDAYTYKWYRGCEVKELYKYRQFANALNFERDTIALAAYKDGNLVAMAGADDYMNELWQIGIDVLPEFRHQGLGLYLVKELGVEIENLNKVPFYATWSPNIASTRVVLGAGFYPVWMGYPSEK